MKEVLGVVSIFSGVAAAALWLWASLVVMRPLRPKPDDRWHRVQAIDVDTKTGRKVEWGRTARWQSAINAAAASCAAVASLAQALAQW
jgi:hypothetical protein